ncbi:SprT-like domain-containing protein [Salmonella enterica]|nr:SprT-like domain-containing protein [Salmonella enterica]
MTLPTPETYDELQRAYDFFSEQLFRGELPPCLITLQREKQTYGYCSFRRFVGRESGDMVDEIAMNPVYFSIRTIKDTLSTLVHEMVHQWQFHFGKSGRRGYHNKEWAALMERVGLMPSDTGQTGGKKVGQSMTHYIIIGGPFDLACDELLTRNFQLSWMDRFPPYQPKPGAPLSPSGKGYIDDDNGDEEDEEGGELDNEIIEAMKFVAPPPETPVNKSNRVRYTCPVCHINLWGKPNLVVLCGGEHCEKAELQPS